jgi:ATP-dependent Clp protease adaptor protein ClpS
MNMTVLSKTTTTLDVETKTKPELTWQTILFNCYCHTFDEVIEQLMKAIGCSATKGSQLANVAEQFGSVSVYAGSEAQCEKVADILSSTGLDVKVSQ